MNDLSRECPCGHSAYLHRSQDQIDFNNASGRRYVGECTGHSHINNWCCTCQVNRAQVIEFAKDTK